jgi:hypothetical protein
MVQRGGDARFVGNYVKGARVTASQIERTVRANADLSARFMTDESPAYIRAGRLFKGGHGYTKHKLRQYAKSNGDHSQTVESLFSLLKRGLYGTFHSVSKQHLPKYLDEFAFRWNHRYINDGERLATAIQGAAGKRLIYRANGAA